MSDSADLEGTQETGGALRAQLEAVLAENAGLKGTIAAEVATRFALVKPEDLKDVPSDQLAAKAAELNETRKQERELILREGLAARGLSEEQIAQTLAKPVTAAQVSTPQPNHFSALNHLEGNRPSDVQFEGLSGPALIRAAIDSRR